jgi:CRISPR/Cas system-associated endoribonuclease Cas2
MKPKDNLWELTFEGNVTEELIYNLENKIGHIHHEHRDKVIDMAMQLFRSETMSNRILIKRYLEIGYLLNRVVTEEIE